MNWSAPFSVRRVAASLKVFFLVALLALLGFSEAARSGGGFGGRSSGSSSSSSSSRSGGGYSGGYSRGGGYGGPIIINNGGGWGGGYYGGGYGYRTGGLGLLGLLPLLMFGGVAIFIIFALVRGLGARRSIGSGNGMGSGLGSFAGSDSAALMVTIIMTEGDDVKRALQSVAQSGDPDSDAGLSQMLQEAALVALRHPERWAYGNVQYLAGDEQRSDAQLGAWETQARAAFTDQTTSNYQNRDLNTGYTHNSSYTPHKETGELYLAVSVGAAARDLAFNQQPVSTQAVQQALQAIAGITPDSLIRAAVVWSPDAQGEFLTEDEAISLYPQTKKL